MEIRRPITPAPMTAIGRVLVSGLVHGVDGIVPFRLKVGVGIGMSLGEKTGVERDSLWH